jgi:hypothetical protein
MKHFKKNRIAFTSTALCMGLLFITSFSQVIAQSADSTKKWSFLAEPYLMFPYMDGETGIGNNLILPVDANPGDIFSKLKMAAMLYVEAKTDKWSINSDLVYMNLTQDVTPGIVLNSGSITAKQLAWETAGLYRVLPFLEVGLGGRLNSVQTSADIWINAIPSGIVNATGRHTATWFDPIIITRLSTDINDKWLFQFRGDLGGFGIGSDFTWQLQAYAGYRFTKVFQLSAGYRVLSIDYQKGEQPKEFVFDLNEFGPALRFGFNF